MAVKDNPDYQALVEEYIRKGFTPNAARKRAYRTITKRGVVRV